MLPRAYGIVGNNKVLGQDLSAKCSIQIDRGWVPPGTLHSGILHSEHDVLSIEKNTMGGNG